MSFYLSYTRNINCRKASNIFYLKDNVLLMLSDNSEVELLKLDEKVVDNPVLIAVNYIKSHSIYGSEILLPPLDDKSLDEACGFISNYLLENDDTIGILTKNPNYRKDYAWLLNKYGITYSIPRPKSMHGRAAFDDGVKPKKRHNFDENRITGGDIVFKTMMIKACVPETRNQEDGLGSGLVLDEPFNTKLIKLLNESGKTNVEVYTKGGITRQVFSNILSKKDIIPRKDTVICLIIGMELNYKDSINLLESAGYALSKSIPLDVIVNKYLKRGIYDLDVINDELDERGCQLLGWKPRDN